MPVKIWGVFSLENESALLRLTVADWERATERLRILEGGNGFLVTDQRLTVTSRGPSRSVKSTSILSLWPSLHLNHESTLKWMKRWLSLGPLLSSGAWLYSHKAHASHIRRGGYKIYLRIATAALGYSAVVLWTTPVHSLVPSG